MPESYQLNKYAATFVKYDGRNKRWRRTDPPGVVSSTLLSKGKWRLPKVTGVVTAPTMRPDGTILSEPGYDGTTQLWHAPAGALRLPPILDSRESAEAALNLLKELLQEFQFVSELDRAVALAGLMTPVLRGACDVVPLIVILAHTASSGKSFLADLASAIVRGQKCPVITAAESQEEMEKRLGAIILEGAQTVSLDNCSHDIGGDLLCQITERPLLRIRILGKSEAPECEWRGTLFANGNNILLVGDMTRRSLLCNLDPQMERPELRRFKFNPIERIMSDRGAYVAAVLTIASAYLASGTRAECEPIASYGQWSRVVREPLIWLGEPDPVKSMDQARDMDPERSHARELVGHWSECLDVKLSYTAREIIEAAEAGEMQEGTFIHHHPEFRDLLLVRCGSGERIEPRKLGNWLMRIRGQIHNGHYRIDLVTESDKHGNRYRLVDLGQQQELPLVGPPGDGMPGGGRMKPMRAPVRSNPQWRPDSDDPQWQPDRGR
jgi:putative DNA primase/helicase